MAHIVHEILDETLAISENDLADLQMSAN